MRRSLLYIGNKLSKHGFTPTGIEYLGPLLEKSGLTIIYSSEKLNPILRLVDMICAIAWNRKVDAVLIDTYSSKAFYYALICSLVCRLLRQPYIIILHGGNFINRKTKSPRMTYMLLSHALHVISVSTYLQRELEGFWPCTFIPNGIKIENYSFTHRRSVQPKLLWVRSFHEIYNPLLALAVIERLKSIYPQAFLTMIGPDKDGSLEKVKAYAEKHQLSQHVLFTGILEKKEWIALSTRSDIFINTTNFDNMPVSVMEAMALGLPVVSTKVGGIPYLIENRTDGLLVQPGNTDMFAQAIKELVESPSMALDLANNARRKIECFDEPEVARKWMVLLDEIL